MKRRFKLFIAIVVVLCLLSACAPTYLTRDKFYTYNDPQKNDQQENMMSSLNVEQQISLFEGTVLFYDSDLDIAICSQPVRNNDGLNSELVIFKDESIVTLSQRSNQYVSARIAADTSEIFYVEKNNILKKTILSKIDFKGAKKTQLVQIDINSTLPYFVTHDGVLFYVNEKNEIISIDQNNNEKTLHKLPLKNSVRKIAYCEDDDFIIFLANVAQEGGNSSNILYRLNLQGNSSLGEIDINVSDFVLSEKLHSTSYVKSTMSGMDHIYIYDHESALRKFLLSNNIERISISSEGKYIFFIAKITEGLPTQSIWLANFETGTAVQLTVNTKITGQIYSTKAEDGIIFTESENISNSEMDQVLRTYKMMYSFNNSIGDN